MTTLVSIGTWGRGVLLYRDEVQVPHPVLGDLALGLGDGPPRAVPYAGVLALLSHLLGAGLAQHLLLVAPLLLAGVGVTALLHRHGPMACAVAALVVIWNPYVAERLGLGQAPTLLAYGALTWLVVAARWSRGRGAATSIAACTVALVPAALTPVGSVLALAVLGVALLVWRRPAREAAMVLVGPLLLCTPWVTAAVVSGSTGAAGAGAGAYAARDDTGAGLLLSVATLGGAWAPPAAPGSRSSAVAVLCGLLLVTAAVAGWWTSRHARLLTAAWAVPVVATVLAASAPGVNVLGHLQGVAAAALFRDTHRLLAPAAVAVALGAGLLVAAAGRTLLAAGGALLLAATAVAGLPDLPATMAEHYRPVQPPADWQRAVATVRESGQGALSLPWQPLRRAAWNGERPFLDPLDRAVGGPVLISQRLQVVREGQVLVTDTDPELSARAWADGQVDPVALAASGVGWVFEWRGTPGTAVQPVAGLTLSQEGPAVRLWRVSAPVAVVAPREGRGLVRGAWLVAAMVLLAALTRLGAVLWQNAPCGRLRKSATSR